MATDVASASAFHDITPDQLPPATQRRSLHQSASSQEGTVQVGDAARVFCRTEGAWFDGLVTAVHPLGRISVEFEVGDTVRRKTLGVTSADLNVEHPPVGHVVAEVHSRVRGLVEVDPGAPHRPLSCEQVEKMQLPKCEKEENIQAESFQALVEVSSCSSSEVRAMKAHRSRIALAQHESAVVHTNEQVKDYGLVLQNVESSTVRVVGDSVEYSRTIGGDECAYLQKIKPNLQGGWYIQGDYKKGTGDQSFCVNISVTVYAALRRQDRHADLAPYGFEFFGDSVEWTQGDTVETWFLYRRDFNTGAVKFCFREECMAAVFVTKLADREYRLDQWEDLWAYIVSADIKFLRREYFEHLEYMRSKELSDSEQESSDCTEARLQMRQKINPKWFATEEELYQELSSGKVGKLVVVSHCWESREHPDPLGLQVAKLALWRNSRERFVFIDFCSLHQQPRTPRQQADFDKALSNMAVLYAHECTQVLRIEAVPKKDPSANTYIRVYDEHGSANFKTVLTSALEWNERPYGQRGWCIAERQWALASGDTRELSRETNDGNAVPFAPKAFQERIKLSKLRFTEDNDTQLVIDLHEKVFWKNSCVTELQHNFTNVAAEEVLTLVDSVACFTNLRLLTLTYTSLTETHCGVLANALANKNRLQKLVLGGNDIGARGATALAEAWRQKNSVLWHMDLSDNALGDDGAAALAKALRHMSALEDLNLSNNAVGHRGTAELAKALMQMPALQWLLLSKNSVGDRGASELAQVLRHNLALKALDLSENALVDEGATELVQAFMLNSNLQQLHLSGNALSKRVAAELAEALRQNSSLQQLHPSEVAQGFDGHWTKGTISGSMLTWKDGSTTALGYPSSRNVRLIVGGTTFDGELQTDDSALKWSNGCVWTREEREEKDSGGFSHGRDGGKGVDRVRMAETLQRKVLQADEAMLGSDHLHPQTLTAEGNLASTLLEAETLKREVLRASVAALGSDHPETLAAKADLARTLIQLGMYTEVEMLRREVLQANEAALGSDHPQTLAAKADHGRTLHKLGKDHEALVSSASAAGTLEEQVLSQLATSGPQDVLELLRALTLAQGKKQELQRLLYGLEKRGLVRKTSTGKPLWSLPL